MSQTPPPLRKCIATVCLSGSLPEKMEAATAAGFDGVEIFENDLLTFDGTPADVRRMADDLGLTLDMYQPFRDFEAVPDAARARNRDRAERKFDVMQQLGTELLLACSNVQPSAIGDDARAAADLHDMAEAAHRRGLRVGYEALAWGRHVNTWGHAWKIVQEADHPALGLVVDSFHTLSLGDDAAGLARVPGGRIFFVQLADAPKLSMDVLNWSRHFRNFPGQGDLDVTGFLRAVLASGYAGPLSLEVFNDSFRSAPARIMARDGLRSLVLVEAEARGAGLPPVPALDGVEFLEFAVDEDAGRELAAFLGTLGFRHAGHHRSKRVDLYRQGRVNLVLNQEQDSAAAEHFLLHGPSVCGMGVRVDDARAALRRAEALLCPAWREEIGEGERSIPGVRAPDGTLVHLVEHDASGPTIWESDFHLFPAQGEPGEFETIDHVVQALTAGRMDSFVLFWRGVFGLQPQQNWETPDPYGLVKSRALVSADGRLRVALNVSESGQTSTGRFLSADAGPGVHHVAFCTGDAARTLERLQALGAPMLPIPANYYNDLAARWGLDEAVLADLQRLGLLYDRDERGEFLHAYTEAFEGRFFFEAVQRRGGYEGFGAVNAAVRTAAQARHHLSRPVPA